MYSREHNERKIENPNAEERIKYFILNLRGWLNTFYGIVTKYLEKYLFWFVLYNNDQHIDYIDIFYSLALENKYIKVIDIG